MPSGRPGGYPYPNGLTTVADVDTYLRTRLYPALISNDSRGEYFRDRNPTADLRALMVRPEWYGAKADGTTDDTTAIQAAADALVSGGALVFTPGKTYATGTIWIDTSNVWIGCLGGRATLEFDDADFHYGIMVHGGTISAANRTLTYYNNTYGLADNTSSRVSGVVVENLDLTSTSGSTEANFDFEWADDCKIINCSSTDSAGNGINLRFTRRQVVMNCKVYSPAAYNVFCWMSRDAIIDGNYFEGGTKGVELKHRYDSEPCNHRVTNNVFADMLNAIGGGLGLLDTETYDYYIGHYEIVEGCLIAGNKFVNTSGYYPIVTVGVCAEQWKLVNNEFDGGGLSGSYAIQLGSSGTYLRDVLDDGTPGQNHIVAGNSFTNGLLTRVIDIGASADIIDNVVSCGIRMFVGESAAVLLASTTMDINVRGNVIRDVYLAVSGQAAIATCGANTKSLLVSRNVLDITPTVNSTNTFVIAVYSTADVNIVTDNYIRIQKGPATHEDSYGIYLDGATNYVSGNYVGIDSSDVAYAISIGPNATDMQSVIVDNIVEDLGTSTSTAIYGDVQIDCRFNTFIGGWTNETDFNDNALYVHKTEDSLFITDNESAEKDLLILDQLGSWGYQKFQNIRWNNSVGKMAAIGPHYQSSTSTTDLVFHSFYNGDYKASTDINAILSGNGNLSLGPDAYPFGASSTNTFTTKNGTAPTGSQVDRFQLYSADIAAGNAAPHFRTEAGNIVKLYKQVLAADLEEAYETPELDTEAEVIAALNATNAKINDLIAALQNTGLLASS